MGQEKSPIKKEQIESLAKKCGFSQVGWVNLFEDSNASQKMRLWLNQNFHGEMSYLERGFEKRKNPALLFNQAKSIICLGFDYSLYSQKGSAFISRYASEKDYHLVLSEKLNLLQSELQSCFPSGLFKSYVDTGPVLEKFWAEQAGLGWMGKHTNLIDTKRGSYFFLASIITSLESEDHPSPSQNHCGKCEACIKVCPTQAIVAPYVLDARLCISYLTIELKGPIPRELRSKIGNHVFGCDDCQEVCPWNRKAKLPEAFLRNPKLEELHAYLSLDASGFKSLFKESPILRSKRRGFLRNVCVVLGNLKRQESLSYLIKALQDPEALVRGHAAWALGQYSETQVINFQLEKTLQKEDDMWVKEELIIALKKERL